MAKRKRVPVKKYEVDIVIPVFGQFDLLEKTLAAIPAAAGTLSYHIIMVDDFSPDQKEANAFYKAHKAENISVIRNHKNMGYPRAVNRGVRIGLSKAILLLNSDVVLDSYAIVKLYNTLLGDDKIPPSPVDPAKSKGVGIVAPKLLFANGYNKVQHAGIFFDLWATPIHRFIGWSGDNRLVNKPIGLQAVSGACLMTRREVWNAAVENQQAAGDLSLGAMNEVYGRGTYEDMEYCISARANGYRVIYDPRAAGTHVVGASAKDTGGYPLTRNKQIFLARCGHLLVYDEWMVT